MTAAVLQFEPAGSRRGGQPPRQRVDPTTPTGKLVEKYVMARRQRGAPKGTIANLRWGLDAWAVHVGNRPLDKIGPADVERLLERHHDIAPASQRSMLSTVRGFLWWAVRQDLVRRNVAAEVPLPRLPRTLPRALVSDAPKKLIAACPDARARFIVTLMLQQGLRCVEISRLLLSDIDMAHGTMRITGKGGHERVLPLMDETLACLLAYLGEHPAAAGPLVRSYTQPRSRLAPGSISRLVAKWMIDAGVKLAPRDGVTPHCGRHTMATDMLLNGAHIRDVQAALGHAHLSSTQVYIPLLVDGLDKAMSGRSYHAVPDQATVGPDGGQFS